MFQMFEHPPAHPQSRPQLLSLRIMRQSCEVVATSGVSLRVLVPYVARPLSDAAAVACH